MTQTTALVTVVSGQAYHDFADAMFESASEHFHPTEEIKFVKLSGREGEWPTGTMYRPHILRDAMPRAHFVYLTDADMRFEGPVGSEILPPRGLGITATLHPGYVGRSRVEYPYETETESACFMDEDEGSAYYCGGFYGGERMAMRILLGRIAQCIDVDVARGHTPVFHDESALNRCLWAYAPDLELSPAYCHPDRDDYYRQHVWSEDYERKLVALDKTADVRGAR